MDYNSQALFNRRLMALSSLMVFCLVILISRLFYLQIVQASRYEELANENRIRVRYIIAGRGNILDRHGKIMVQNKGNFQAILIPEESSKYLASVEKLKKILHLDDGEVKKILESIHRQPKFMATLIRAGLTWEEVSKLEALSIELPGVIIENGIQRDYFMGPASVHPFGYVSLPNRKEVDRDKSLALPGLKIGKMGLEHTYDSILRGVAGQKQVEVNARGRLVKELSEIPSESGKDLQTTLDKDLQEFTANYMAPYKSSLAIVMDIHTGGILTMVSTPGFDPQLFFNGIKKRTWQELQKDPLSPMTNKAVAGNYSPGSVFKIIVALGLLKAGINPLETVHCPGHMMVGNHKFHCWRSKEGHGSINFTEALERSCDVYFYHMALRIGAKPIIDMARALGCTTRTGIDLPGEQKGFIADPAWKKKTYKQAWYPGDTILTAIGQGYVLMTPVQLITMMAQVANGGRRVVPHFYQEKKVEPETVDLNPDHVKLVLKGLQDVVNSSRGTAYSSRLNTENFQMGGKTGTAQVRRITMQERLAGVRDYPELPWHLRDNSLFVGYAPAHEPKYAVVVVGEHEGWGSGFAAHTAKAIMEKLYHLEKQNNPGAVPLTTSQGAP